MVELSVFDITCFKGAPDAVSDVLHATNIEPLVGENVNAYSVQVIRNKCAHGSDLPIDEWADDIRRACAMAMLDGTAVVVVGDAPTLLYVLSGHLLHNKNVCVYVVDPLADVSVNCTQLVRTNVLPEGQRWSVYTRNRVDGDMLSDITEKSPPSLIVATLVERDTSSSDGQNSVHAFQLDPGHTPTTRECILELLDLIRHAVAMHARKDEVIWAVIAQLPPALAVCCGAAICAAMDGTPTHLYYGIDCANMYACVLGEPDRLDTIEDVWITDGAHQYQRARRNTI